MQKRFSWLIRLSLGVVALLSSHSFALDADDLGEFVGFTIIAVSNVRGDFEGADFNKRVALDNGMVFEFSTYSYSYAYRPTAAVLARAFSVEELRRLKMRIPPTRPITIYKLIIDDDTYDVARVR